MPPPLLYDLTELQRHANRLYGFSAQKTLGPGAGALRAAQADQLPAHRQPAPLDRTWPTTLPRTSWRPIAGRYAGLLAPGTGERPLGRRFVDDAKVTDHHAIIPTADLAGAAVALSADERKIYDLVCRRLLAAWHDDHVWSVTTVITAIANEGRLLGPVVDRYHSSGTAVQQAGLEGAGRRRPRKTRRTAGTTGSDETAEREADEPRSCRPASPRGSGRTCWRPGRRPGRPGRPSASPRPRCSPPWRRPARRSTRRSSPTR